MVLPYANVEPMMQDPFGPLCKDKQADEKIRTRLWNYYEPFEQNVLEVREALESIVAQLRVNITSDGEVEWVDKRWMSREFKKFLHRLNRKEYEDALNTICRGITMAEGQATKIFWDQVKVKTMLSANTQSPSPSPAPTPTPLPSPLSSSIASKTKRSKFVSFLNFKPE
ncbi:hypothetical protein QBC43DRAFT_294774 [Cladorrhinum sp. PSN259]|nr:hypothetical protein QBC43DRAFT_294774 [Cladorrhinum sp. PSN259]